MGGKQISLSGSVRSTTDNKLSDKTRIRNEAQFNLLDAIPLIVWMMQADGRNIWFNQRWLGYSGLSMEESLGHSWTRLVHPDDSLRASSLWDQALGGSEPCEIECRLRRADGVYRWMLGRARPQRDGVGQVTQWLGTLTDVDDMKLASERQEKELAMNRIATRVAHLGGWTIELPERTLTWSDENCAINDAPPGYTPSLEEGIGSFLPEHRATVIRHIEACIQQGTPYEFVLPKMTIMGRLIWVRSMGEAVYDAAGNVVRIQGVFKDISAQKEAEANALALKQRLITTLESVTDGFFLLDTDWKFTYLNGPAERMLDGHRADLLGKSLWETFPGTLGTRIEREFRNTVNEQRTTRFEVFYLPANVWLYFHVYPADGLAVYFQDNLERRRQQIEIQSLNTELEKRVVLRTAQLEEANKALESFSYSVSHDLRGPLHTLEGFSHLLVKSEANTLSEKGKRHLDRIRSGIKQMGELIDGLLSLSQQSRKKLGTDTVNLSVIARGIEQDFRAQDPLRKAHVQIQDGLCAEGDPRLLLAVLQNLMGNAWKFTSKLALARIYVGSQIGDKGQTIFFVKDNGVGFDMAFKDRLFGSFERLHSNEDFAGTGIGLATVKRAIEYHGGSVWAEAKLNDGATFFFTLRRTTEPVE